MSVSCICHECHKVKRCQLYTRKEVNGTRGVNYLCRPCARVLGYLTTTTEEQGNGMVRVAGR